MRSLLPLWHLLLVLLFSNNASHGFQTANHLGSAVSGRGRLLACGRAVCASPRLRARRAVPLAMVEDKGRRETGGDAQVSLAVKLLMSRRGFISASAAAAASGVVLKDLSSLVAPAAHAEDAVVREEVMYDLGLDKDYKAPGRIMVDPEGTVETSPADKRSYRSLVLANGLRVLIASDPKVETSAAALNVHVGHFSDPDYVPGLAHFCEHMLFLGNKKFPQEGELENFLSSYSGSSNAYTSDEDTCYFFNLNSAGFRPALERFSQFFVSPLFTATAVSREINAVDSENSKNLQTDSWRFNQLEKVRANPAHPVAKFGTGNKETLEVNLKKSGRDVREELLKFYDKYYSANMMSLAVIGREDLNTLQSWVEELFSPIPNKDVKPPEESWAGKILPYSREASNVVYNVVPIQDERSLLLTWQIPYKSKEDKERRMKSKPDRVIGSILGYEGKNSLLSYLKTEKGLVSSIFAGVADSVADFQSFVVSVELTIEGFKRRDEVVASIFSYLDLVRREGIPSYVLREVEDLSQVFWRFKETEEPDRFVGVVSSMQAFKDPRLYLSGPALARDLQLDLAQELLSALTPQSAMLTYASKEFAKDAKMRERWYGTSYYTEEADKSRWGRLPLAGVSVPQPNPFIPSNFDIKGSIVEDLAKPAIPPSLLVDDSTWRLFFKQDRRYGKPKAVAYVLISQFDSLLGTGTTPRTSALTKLLTASLADALTEFSYDAAVAGLQYSCDFTQRGVRLNFGGYNDKLADFLLSVAERIKTHVPEGEDKLARYKDLISRDLRAFTTQQPYQHAAEFSRLCLELPAYLPTDVERELDGISLKELKEWTKRLWEQGYSQLLIQGNVREEEARAVAGRMREIFSFKEVPEEQRSLPRLLELPIVREGRGNLLRRKELNPDNPNSAVVVQFQNVNPDLKEQMAMEVLASIVQQPFYSELRTNQQLGYIVYAGIAKRDGSRFLIFTTQSSVVDANEIASRIFSFVDSFDKQLEQLGEDQVSKFVTSLIERKQETDKKLADEVLGHWDEIATSQYNFDRYKEEVEALRLVDKRLLQQVWASVVKTGGEQRRAITCEVYSQQLPNTQQLLAKEPKDGSRLILDPEAFRKQLNKVARRPAKEPQLRASSA